MRPPSRRSGGYGPACAALAGGGRGVTGAVGPGELALGRRDLAVVVPQVLLGEADLPVRGGRRPCRRRRADDGPRPARGPGRPPPRARGRRPPRRGPPARRSRRGRRRRRRGAPAPRAPPGRPSPTRPGPRPGRAARAPRGAGGARARRGSRRSPRARSPRRSPRAWGARRPEPPTTVRRGRAGGLGGARPRCLRARRADELAARRHRSAARAAEARVLARGREPAGDARPGRPPGPPARRSAWRRAPA